MQTTFLLRVAAFAVASFALLALPDCGGQSCSLLACGSSVVVRVHDSSGAAAPAFHGTLTAGSAIVSFACGGSNPTSGTGFNCTNAGEVTFALNGGPAQLTVQADGASGAFSGSLSSIATPTYPNGAACTPECYSQPLVVTLH